MNTTKVVMYSVQRDGMAKVVNLLTECICKAREAPYAHTHGEVLAFNVASRNVPRVGSACNRRRLRSNARRGTVARLWLHGIFRRSVEFYQGCIVNFGSKGVFNCIQVNLVPVRGELDAVRESACQVLHESVGAS